MKHSDYQIDSGSVDDNGASSLQERVATVDRRELAALLMKLFEHWQLSSQEQLHALGLAPSPNPSARQKSGEITSSKAGKTTKAAGI